MVARLSRGAAPRRAARESSPRASHFRAKQMTATRPRRPEVWPQQSLARTAPCPRSVRVSGALPTTRFGDATRWMRMLPGKRDIKSPVGDLYDGVSTVANRRCRRIARRTRNPARRAAAEEHGPARHQRRRHHRPGTLVQQRPMGTRGSSTCYGRIHETPILSCYSAPPSGLTTSEGPTSSSATPSQQVAQLDDFALCACEGRESRASGEMRLRDMRIIEAIYASMRAAGKRMPVNA